MTGAGLALLVVGTVFLLLAPPVLVALALEGRARRHRAGSRLYATAAMWASLAVYAVSATGVATRAITAPDGPAWRKVLVGLARSSPAELSLLVAGGVATAGCWWLLRGEGASGGSVPSTPLDGGK